MRNNISALLLAAGLSTRMGQPKLLLPWNKTTVLGQVISTFAAAGMEEIVVVTGAAREQIEGLVSELADILPIRSVHNPEYANGEMLGSIRAGLAALSSNAHAALIGLGDQPQVLEQTIRCICDAYVRNKSPMVIPSFQNRRGHPWLAARPLWPKIMALPTSTTPRQFLNTYAGQVEYVAADQSILQDLDTPSDYARQRP
jgi:molybdenum cofactor cytidylyltransferase